MKCHKKPTILEATQCFKHGDHSFVKPFNNDERHSFPCWSCSRRLDEHGWVDYVQGVHCDGRRVCPGDWVVSDKFVVIEAMHDKQFRTMYDIVEEERTT